MTAFDPKRTFATSLKWLPISVWIAHIRVILIWPIFILFVEIDDVSMRGQVHTETDRLNP